jgi:endonuclease/exonuclease/phosphatase family metal-dependent hydrolase
MPIKIICLNAWGGRLHAELVDYLRAEDADVVCVQEVVHTPGAPAEMLVYRDGDHVLDQRANLFADLAAAQPGHVATFCPAARGDLWAGETAVPSYWGIATFVRARLPVVAQAQGFVHKSYSPHGYGDHPRSRNAHVVRIYDGDGDRAVTVAHMHGLRDLAGKGDTPARAAQARAFVDLVDSVTEPGDALVVCGDLNVEPLSETLTILGSLGVDELVTGRGFSGTRSSHYRKPGRFADYMLVGKDVAVIDFAVIGAPEVSDHCPLRLVI